MTDMHFTTFAELPEGPCLVFRRSGGILSTSAHRKMGKILEVYDRSNKLWRPSGVIFQYVKFLPYPTDKPEG